MTAKELVDKKTKTMLVERDRAHYARAWMCRPDRGSDLFIAGYIAGLQGHALARKEDR